METMSVADWDDLTKGNGFGFLGALLFLIGAGLGAVLFLIVLWALSKRRITNDEPAVSAATKDVETISKDDIGGVEEDDTETVKKKEVRDIEVHYMHEVSTSHGTLPLRFHIHHSDVTSFFRNKNSRGKPVE